MQVQPIQKGFNGLHEDLYNGCCLNVCSAYLQDVRAALPSLQQITQPLQGAGRCSKQAP